MSVSKVQRRFFSVKRNVELFLSLYHCCRIKNKERSRKDSALVRFLVVVSDVLNFINMLSLYIVLFLHLKFEKKM